MHLSSLNGCQFTFENNVCLHVNLNLALVHLWTKKITQPLELYRHVLAL